jgi:hypothetical protein
LLARNTDQSFLGVSPQNRCAVRKHFPTKYVLWFSIPRSERLRENIFISEEMPSLIACS